MNEPAMISFFSVTGVILLVAGVAIWRTHGRGRRSRRMHSTKAEADNDDDTAIENDCDDGWAQVPNTCSVGVQEEEEMRSMARGRPGVDEKVYQTPLATVSITPGVEAETSQSHPMIDAQTSKGSRPTDIVAFENLGGYRYGDFAYGHDNMAPLPVPPASSQDRHLNPYSHHSPAGGIAEVEAVPAPAACPYPPPTIQTSDRVSVELGQHGSGSRLTSYNGLPPHRDDMMAALPIPKDHPLYQHHPHHQVVECPAPAPAAPNKQDHPDRSKPPPPTTIQYERESLVPAPLNPRRGRHNSPQHVGDQNHKPTTASTTEPPAALEPAVPTLARPSSAPARQPTSISRSTGQKTETRYSVFESPLRQHPPELKRGLQDATRDIVVQTPVHDSRAIICQIGADDQVQNEWPLTTARERVVRSSSSSKTTPTPSPFQLVQRCYLDDRPPNSIFAVILQAIEVELDGRGFQGVGIVIWS
ncbi:uncharacterized protein Z520_08108 [Fonsecaea multimorphosa CBS 102226]|uniref:Uncharacterized protein n=1 Tax=Fonsecaea multimorphosa CBS 102226 TaxID=1442371 RepID=A0A0D2H3C0_9EURO|nr:uncharacterized protein Z520_08108 [Fonsecaea multimorphosa CBS 102226]KIX96330.1 hypothetical protein Z520_08108 [Fonsecaea multimorphosa CBS 102226]